MQECFQNVAWAEKKSKRDKKESWESGCGDFSDNSCANLLDLFIFQLTFVMQQLIILNTSIAYNVKRDPVIVCWSTTCLKDEPCWRTTCSAGCWQTWQAWGREEERGRQPGLKRWLGSFLGILIKICHPSLWWWDSSGDSQSHLGPLQSIFHAELEEDPLYSIKNANLLWEQRLICNTFK